MQLGESVGRALAARRYAQGLRELIALRGAVDDFFERTMVMDENPGLRNNRLALLRRRHSGCRPASPTVALARLSTIDAAVAFVAVHCLDDGVGLLVRRVHVRVFLVAVPRSLRGRPQLGPLLFWVLASPLRPASSRWRGASTFRRAITSS